MDDTDKATISRVLNNVLDHMLPHISDHTSLLTPPAASDLQSIRTLAVQHAEAHNYDLAGVQKYLIHGAMFACTAYNHLPERCRIWVVLFDAVMFALDDGFECPPPGTDADEAIFERRLEQQLELLRIAGTPTEAYKDPTQRLLVELLKEAGQLWPQLPAAAQITGSVLRFVSSLVVDWQARGRKLPPEAKEYSNWSRYSSSAAEAHAVIMFSPNVFPGDYHFAMPDLMLLIASINDVFSFYKESLAGETNGRIYYLAQSLKISPVEGLERAAAEVIATHKRILAILQESSDARQEYDRFLHGYISFHCSLPRYRNTDILGVRKDAEPLARVFTGVNVEPASNV